VPFQAFPAADGWIVVACPKEKFWRRLADAIGRPELADDARFNSFAQRRRNVDVLVPLLESVFSTRSADAWVSALAAAGVPCGPVNTVAQALADPQTKARNMLFETEHPHFGTLVQVSSAVRVGPEPQEHRRAPRRNENAADVLHDLLGYSPARRRELEDDGAFGPVSPDPVEAANASDSSES
jgi:crotonobetainyl-CoA:carnitine CoA-transferase CaiB-like acyl-CoA transferase